VSFGRKPVDLDEVRKLCDAATPGPLEAIALGSEGYAIRPKIGDLRQRARVAMCGYRAWEEDRANAEFFAAARTLLPQMADELEECRTQRDENLANVRRIDDLRITETARLQRDLDAAREADARLSVLAERSYFGSRPGSKERALAEAIVRILNEAAGTDRAQAGEGA
jgi:hypothetical protein